MKQGRITDENKQIADMVPIVSMASLLGHVIEDTTAYNVGVNRQ